MENTKQLHFKRETIRSETPPAPSTIIIGLTNTCNHACVFCSYRKQKSKPVHIDEKLLQRIIYEGYDLGVCEIGFPPDLSEPFMSKNLEDAVHAASTVGYTYIYLTTNGVLAGPKRIRRLLENGLGSIKFSVNAGDRDTYYKTHGHDDFDRVIENIIEADKIRKELNLNAAMFLSFVEYRDNYGQLENLQKRLGSAIDHYYLYPAFLQNELMMEELKSGLINNVSFLNNYNANRFTNGNKTTIETAAHTGGEGL